MISETEFLVRNVNDSESQRVHVSKLSPLEIYRTNHMAWDLCVIAALPLWSYEKKENTRERESEEHERERVRKTKRDAFLTLLLVVQNMCYKQVLFFSFSFSYFFICAWIVCLRFVIDARMSVWFWTGAKMEPKNYHRNFFFIIISFFVFLSHYLSLLISFLLLLFLLFRLGFSVLSFFFPLHESKVI